MEVNVNAQIDAPIEAVWKTITNFENSAEFISGITKIEVLHKPDIGQVGFKWRETRMMFGKEAAEDMWITEIIENQHYDVDAQSHGTKYSSRISVQEKSGGTFINMKFTGQPLTLTAKIMSKIMMPFFKGSMVKALQKDMDDIKVYVEAR